MSKINSLLVVIVLSLAHDPAFAGPYEELLNQYKSIRNDIRKNLPQTFKENHEALIKGHILTQKADLLTSAEFLRSYIQKEEALFYRFLAEHADSSQAYGTTSDSLWDQVTLYRLYAIWLLSQMNRINAAKDEIIQLSALPGEICNKKNLETTKQMFNPETIFVLPALKFHGQTIEFNLQNVKIEVLATPLEEKQSQGTSTSLIPSVNISGVAITKDRDIDTAIYTATSAAAMAAASLAGVTSTLALAAIGTGAGSVLAVAILAFQGLEYIAANHEYNEVVDVVEEINKAQRDAIPSKSDSDNRIETMCNQEFIDSEQLTNSIKNYVSEAESAANRIEDKLGKFEKNRASVEIQFQNQLASQKEHWKDETESRSMASKLDETFTKRREQHQDILKTIEESFTRTKQIEHYRKFVAEDHFKIMEVKFDLEQLVQALERGSSTTSDLFMKMRISKYIAEARKAILNSDTQNEQEKTTP